jgi:alpha-mannosidase
VTWVTLDAPLVEVGSITATVMGSRNKPEAWLAKLEPSQTLYSWVMNNHWYTNYRAEQDGPTTFRYSLLPHKQYDAVAAQRFGIECSQPLVAAAAQGPAPSDRPLLEVDAPQVIVASIKPSEDHKATIVRLFGAGGQAARASLRWGRETPQAVWISNLAEERVAAARGAVDVPAWGLVTLRAEWSVAE